MSATLTQTRKQELSTEVQARQAAGQAANHAAAERVFQQYREETATAENTHRSQLADLQCFAEFWAEVMAQAGMAAPAGEEFFNEPAAWAGVTYGILESFKQWQLQRGAAIATINHRLSTCRTYAELAARAGAIPGDELRLIQTVKGISRKAAKAVNAKRDATRVGHKKAEHVSLTDDQARELKSQPDTPQGRRDALLMCLLLDHGLRASEVALLQVSHFDLKAGTLTFYRPKVDMEQTHKLTADTLRALHSWINSGDCAPMGPVLRGSRRGGQLTQAGMSVRAITKRVQVLGEEIGIEGLSAHDCRHKWATYWGSEVERGRISLLRLQEAGGWASLAMPRRYVEWAKIANEGMNHSL